MGATPPASASVTDLRVDTTIPLGLVVDERTGARKADAEKVRVDLLPVDALLAAAEVFTYGAAKYEARNWEKGFDWSRIYGATLRHLWAWFRGEDIDKESGYHHLAHAACCVLMLLAMATRPVGRDDRP